MIRDTLTRRDALTLAAATGAAMAGETFAGLARALAQAASGIITRPIPKSGEQMPVVGIGTAIIFDFPASDATKMAERAAVLAALAAGGGRLVDTAPSYGEAEARLGELIAAAGLRDRLFLATKARVGDRDESFASFRASLQRLRTRKVDLLQLHNPRRAEQDLAPYREAQKEGLCKYIGCSSSFDRDYAAIEVMLKRERPDFFQIDYSMVDRNAQERLIPAAHDAGCAVLTNLPFGRGRFFRKVKDKPLPEWAAKELGVTSWAQYSLKWSLGHPAITAVIPGTDKPQYMIDNLKAGHGPLPDATMRKRMVDYFDAL